LDWKPTMTDLPECDIEDRAWSESLTAPLTEADDVEGRLNQLEAAFQALHPMVRPLAVEVETCWRELETGLPARNTYPDPPVRVFVEPGVPEGVVVLPATAGPPPIVSVPSLGPKALHALVGAERAQRPGLVLDWVRCETLTVAASTSEPISALRTRQLGVVQAFEPGWFAGPIDKLGYRLLPPIRIWLFADASVTMTIVVHWSYWARANSKERAFLEAACERLDRAGWVRDSDDGMR